MGAGWALSGVSAKGRRSSSHIERGEKQRRWSLRDFESPADQQSASSFWGGGRDASGPRDHTQGDPVSLVSLKTDLPSMMSLKNPEHPTQFQLLFPVWRP